MKRWLLGVVAVALLTTWAVAAHAAPDAPVTTGSPITPFSQNKQNEPYVAVDPSNAEVVAAGANDEIDEPPCNGADCPFTPGVGVSGIYFSFDGGQNWTQPTYQGFSARTGTPGPGPIGTLPHYFDNGLASDGDPSLVFGPQPDRNGGFSYDNGARLYYANLAANSGATRSDFAFKGFEAIAVSHTDSPTSAATGDAAAWSAPTVVSSHKQSSATFSDKEEVTADNAGTSPFFGNVYVCYSRFQSVGSEPLSISVTRSTDGGSTWAKPQHLTASYDSTAQPGRQGCQVRTDSHGVVYVAWEDTVNHRAVMRMARSFDGGQTFQKPFVVASVTDVGAFDSVRSVSFDGIAGARTDSFPSLDIANGAPSGAGAPDTIALGWSDGADGLNHEHALVQLSSDRGRTWSPPVTVEQPGDRPDFAFIALSPDGTDMYVVYDAFLDHFRKTTAHSRRFQGVVRHADVSGRSLGTVTTLHRGPVGDARASSSNSLIDEFIGDYNTVAATDTGAVAVYNDASNAALCPAINAYRQSVADGSLIAAPAPGTDCPATFGNTDILSAALGDPTP